MFLLVNEFLLSGFLFMKNNRYICDYYIFYYIRFLLMSLYLKMKCFFVFL